MAHSSRTSHPSTVALSTYRHLLGAITAIDEDSAAADLISDAQRSDPELTSEIRAALLTQRDLRRHARAKFGDDALDMVFTRDGVEQATRGVIADLHAARLVAAGCRSVADLGCGIGADARAFARAGLAVEAWEIDPTTRVVAADNLRHWSHAHTHLGDVTTLDIDGLGVDALFVDPARRTGHARGARRIASPDQWSPPLPLVWSWRGRGQHGDRLGVKVAPGIDYSQIPADVQAQWVSVDGSLVEAALWTPGLAPEGSGRSATIVTATDVLTLSEPGAANSAPTALDPIAVSEVIVEPDPAIIRAGLLAHFADIAMPGSSVIAPGIAYLTASTAPMPPWDRVCAAFSVLEVTKLKSAAIATAVQHACESCGIDAASCDIEVKKRGCDIDPAAVRREVMARLHRGRDRGARPSRKPGSSSARLTVIATRVGTRHGAIVTRRLPISEPSMSDE